MTTIRVLIADESPLARRLLADLLNESADLRVIGCAGNGREAVDLTLRLRPDLLIMDLALPGLDGQQAIERIMAGAPTPVLVLAAAVDAAPFAAPESERILDCIKRGALDFLEKPAAGDQAALAEFAGRLIDKARLLSCIRVIRRPRRRQGCRAAEESAARAATPSILAIGASTGGPKGVMAVLKSLPAHFPGTVFVVQHLAEAFAEGFVAWLNRECALPVRLAEDGGKYWPGEAVIARGGSHLTVADGRTWLKKDAPVNCCRPSIDVLFSSLARERGGQAVGLLLSGMGKDGAQGLLRIKESGGITLVQDRQSCAIFGMPKAALDLDAASQALSLDRMPAAIRKLFAC